MITLHLDEVVFPDTQERFSGAMRRDKSRLQDWRSSACATLTHSVIIRCVARWSADTMPPCLNWVQAWAVALGMTDVATNSQFTAYDAGELYIR